MKCVTVLVVAAGLCCSAAAANLFPNPGFEVAGSLGSLVVTNSGGGEAAAAAGWSTFRPVATPITTELLASTNPLPGGGGKMMRLTTESGFVSSAANGAFCSLLANADPGAVASIDMLVGKGVNFTLGFVVGGGFAAGSINAVGTGVWQRFEIALVGGASNTFGVEINSGDGGTILLDNAVLVPSPAAWGTLLGVASIGMRRRRSAA